jgi:hypothetical protein
MARRSYEKKIAALREKLTKEEKLAEKKKLANEREYWFELHPRKRLSRIEARYRGCLANERKNRKRNERKYLHNLDGTQIMDTCNFKGTKEEMFTIITRSTPGWPGPDPQPTSSQWLMQFASYPKLFQGAKYREVAG